MARNVLESLIGQYQGWLVQGATFLTTYLGVYLIGRFVLVPPVVGAVRLRNENNHTLVEAVELYLKVVLATVAFPVAIAAAGLGKYLSGSAVVVAAVTLAVGVAGQDVISNLVSGIFLVADRNFNVGDHIRWGDRSGTVVRVGLRTTRVRTPANEIVTVPNNDLSTMPVTHPFDGMRYRVDERLYVGYGDTARVRTVAAKVVEGDERVLSSPEPVVHVTELGPNAVELAVRYWVVDPAETDIQSTRTAVAEQLTTSLSEAGVTVAPASAQELSGRVAVERAGEPADT